MSNMFVPPNRLCLTHFQACLFAMFLMWFYVKSHSMILPHFQVCLFASYMVMCRFSLCSFACFACFTIYFWFCIFFCFTSILNPTSFILINEREYQPLTKFSMLNTSNNIFIWTKEAQITTSLNFFQRNNVYSFFLIVVF